MLPQPVQMAWPGALFTFNGMLGLRPRAVPEKGLDVGESGLNCTGREQLAIIEQVMGEVAKEAQPGCHFRSHIHAPMD